MLPDFAARLHAFAEVVVRIGLNLQPGQRILAHDPYELQGVARSAEVITGAVQRAASEAGAAEPGLDVIWGDGPRLRATIEVRDWRSLESAVRAHAARMQNAIAGGDALLFLCGSHPRLTDGLPPESLATARRITWEAFGPVAQQLMQGATNWTCVPAPSPGWAAATFEFLPAEQRLTALWSTVFSALRCESDAISRWQTHLAELEARCAALNTRCADALHFHDAHTDLKVKLPAAHRWCTARRRTTRGVAFVANLPTEEIFTAPCAASARGHISVSRPVISGGIRIEDAVLEFRDGEVIAAGARCGEEALLRLLETDSGARRLGEVALVEKPSPWASAAPVYHHALLDENAANHVALGESYGFCHAGPSPELNRSLIHLDLPLTARATLT